MDILRSAPAGDDLAEFDQEEAEPVDADAQRHHRDRGTNPGQHGAFVGQVLGYVMKLFLLPPQVLDLAFSHGTLRGWSSCRPCRRACRGAASTSRLLPESGEFPWRRRLRHSSCFTVRRKKR